MAPFEPTAGETQLARMLHDGEFAISVQVDPPLGANPEALIEAARAVRESGRAQFVDVNDNPRARARMSGIMASVAIERFTGVETIPHLTPRDMTIVGLESQLLGAHAEGVRNILAVTGDPPEAGDYPGTHAVYDVDSVGLVELIAKLNAGEDWHGRAIDAPTTFFPGVAVSPTADDLGLEADRFHRKVAAGARFAMTQILFDLEALEAFRERIGGWPVPVLVGVWPIRTTETLVRVHNEVPGIVVPEHVQERYRAAGPGARDVGLALGRELIEGARAARERRLRRRAVPPAARRGRAPPRASLGRADVVGDGARAGVREIAADDRRRDAVAARRAETCGEDHRLDPAGRVDRRPAGVAVLDPSRHGGDRPRDRPVAERVLRQHRRRPADPARGCCEPSVERVAEDRDGGVRLRVDEAQRLADRLPRRGARRRRCGRRARRRRPGPGAVGPECGRGSCHSRRRPRAPR